MPRIAFSFGRAEKIAKNPRCAFRTSISRSGAASLSRSLDIPRRSHARNVYVPRKNARGKGGGMEVEVTARNEVEDGIGIANIPLLRLSGSLQSHRSISPLRHRPSVRPSAALTPERVRGAYRRACFKESSLDDKSPDFAGFKFVTVLNCDANASLLLSSS